MIAEPTHQIAVSTGARNSRLFTKFVVVLALVLAGFVPTVAAAPAAHAAGPQLVAFDQEMIRLVNVKRVAAGLPAVQEAKGLTGLSLWWSSQLADGYTGGVLQHNPWAFDMVLSWGASNRTTWGENVAKWSPASVTAQTIFDAYWASPGHKANILGAAFRYVGMASTTGANGTSFNTMTFTDKVDAGQVVGTPTTPPPANPAEGNPKGDLNTVTLTGSTVKVTGWAFDPNDPTKAIAVHVYDYLPGGGAASVGVTANVNRPDVASYFPKAGAAHGYSTTINVAGRGTHRICAYAINVGVGTTNPELGCKSISIGGPYGYVDALKGYPAGATVGGWAIDPDKPTSASKIQIVDNGAEGARTYTVSTGGTRNDVAGIFPGTGSKHGFATNIPIYSEGTHRICGYALPITPGVANGNLGCMNLVVKNPIGYLDRISAKGNTITVRGWALETQKPTTTMQVHIYVTGPAGTGSIATTANQVRNDVAAAVPGTGNAHGFLTDIGAMGKGWNKACAFAISTGPSTGNPSLGCMDVFVP